MTHAPRPSVFEIRAVLNELESDRIADDVIRQAIQHAGPIVEETATEDAAKPLLRTAMVDVAAYRSVVGAIDAWATNKEALDAAVEYDVENRVRALKEQADESLDRVAKVDSPKLFTVGERRQRSSPWLGHRDRRTWR